MVALLLPLTILGSKLSDSVPKGWGEDFEAAKKAAASEGKSVLLAFSGSDWCGWCVKLEKEVFSQRAFVAEARKQFVLTMIDSPRNTDILSKLARKQNPQLTQRYGICGFPCGVICDAEGNELGRISGYVKGGPTAYLERMRAMVKDVTPARQDSDPNADALRIFSSGVPMGGMIQRAEGGPEASAVAALIEKKIAENKKSIGRIGIAMGRMTSVKDAQAAKGVLGEFKSAVKSYLQKYVSGYEKWPLEEWEAVGEKQMTAKSCVTALDLVISRIQAEKVRAVYEKACEEMKKQERKLEAKYKEMFAEKFGRNP